MRRRPSERCHLEGDEHSIIHMDQKEVGRKCSRKGIKLDLRRDFFLHWGNDGELQGGEQLHKHPIIP